MPRFRDWPLRYKLVAMSATLVVGVTITMLGVFLLNFRQLHRYVIPNQRVILSLESRGYDYLSETREYALTREAHTLADLSAISKEMAVLLDEYDLFHHAGRPAAVTSAKALRGRVQRLTEAGLRVVGVKDRLHNALEDVEKIERALVSGGLPRDRTLPLVFEFLSEVREYLLHPEAQTLDEIAELRQAIASLQGEEEFLSAELSQMFTIGHLAVSLRQELSEALESIEDEERRLRTDLAAATELARQDVVDATRQLVALVVVTGVLGLAVAVLAAIVLAGRIARPIEQLRDAAQRFAGGELGTRAPVESKDELGELCVSFNQLASEVERLVKELQESLVKLRQSQVQNVQSGKMIAVGELAANVAHELNNPLSVVLTYSILMQEACDKLSEAERRPLASFPERLGLVKTSAQRCKTIIDGLLHFSRQDDTGFTPVDLGDVLARTFELIGSQLRRHQVRWSLDLAPQLPPVRANANQLQQIFTNLALNAMQAMSSGGEVTIVARIAGSEDAGSEDAGFCKITFTDTGVGIAPDHLERVFEPFFTTKASGEGTGLGLSIVYGIIQRHGGRIAIDSAVGRGTTFRIHLPLVSTEGSLS